MISKQAFIPSPRVSTSLDAIMLGQLSLWVSSLPQSLLTLGGQGVLHRQLPAATETTQSQQTFESTPSILRPLNETMAHFIWGFNALLCILFSV